MSIKKGSRKLQPAAIKDKRYFFRSQTSILASIARIYEYDADLPCFIISHNIYLDFRYEKKFLSKTYLLFTFSDD